jgi:hypothetical protein
VTRWAPCMRLHSILCFSQWLRHKMANCMASVLWLECMCTSSIAVCSPEPLFDLTAAHPCPRSPLPLQKSPQADRKSHLGRDGVLGLRGQARQAHAVCAAAREFQAACLAGLWMQACPNQGVECMVRCAGSVNRSCPSSQTPCMLVATVLSSLLPPPPPPHTHTHPTHTHRPA